MTNNVEQWRRHLETLGSDFSLWPDQVSLDDQREIVKMPEYLAAQQVDGLIKAETFPEFDTEDLLARTMERLPARHQQIGSIVFFFQRPSFVVSLMVLFLFCGISTGFHLGTQPQQEARQSYYSIGASYGYNVSGEVPRG